MPIDFSYLEDAAPQKESTPTQIDTANVTIRADADSMLLCDGECVDIQLKAGVITKTKLPMGKHLLEFMSTEASGIKVEKAVDFPEVGKNYLVLISDLSKSIEAKKKAEAIKKAELEAEAEAKRKAEEEAQRLAGEAKRKAEEEARAKAEAEAKKKAEEEAQRLAEEAKRKVAEEEAEAKRKAIAEAEAKNGALNGHDYVDLGLPSGLKWATCNVGASLPEEYGDYYAWGEVQTKMYFSGGDYSLPKTADRNISGNPTYDVARAEWGSTWRMPTKDEFKELIDECKWELVYQKGFKVIGPNGTSIFLPFAGRKQYDQQCGSTSKGDYWSSTKSQYHPCDLRLNPDDDIFFTENKQELSENTACYGLSIRPVSGGEAKRREENGCNKLCDLVLVHVSARGIMRVLMVLRETLGIPFKGADLANTPCIIKKSIPKSEAEAFKRQLEEAGAECEIR